MRLFVCVPAGRPKLKRRASSLARFGWAPARGPPPAPATRFAQNSFYWLASSVWLRPLSVSLTQRGEIFVWPRQSKHGLECAGARRLEWGPARARRQAGESGRHPARARLLRRRRRRPIHKQSGARKAQANARPPEQTSARANVYSNDNNNKQQQQITTRRSPTLSSLPSTSRPPRPTRAGPIVCLAPGRPAGSQAHATPPTPACGRPDARLVVLVALVAQSVCLARAAPPGANCLVPKTRLLANLANFRSYKTRTGPSKVLS